MFGGKKPSSMLTQMPIWNSARTPAATLRTGRQTSSNGSVTSHVSTNHVISRVTQYVNHGHSATAA